MHHAHSRESISDKRSRAVATLFNESMGRDITRVSVRIAVVDSGVHAAHPHVGGVAGGIGIDANGRSHGDFIDRLGHGTAVTAAIKEKVPGAELHVIKLFDRDLTASVTALVSALDWAVRHRMKIINLSLGTVRLQHERILREAVRRALEQNVIIVSARSDGGTWWLPGTLPGVVPVELDASCPRDEYRVGLESGRPVIRASGFPRPIPGVPPVQNLNGVSFAVANVTGFVAQVVEAWPEASIDDVMWMLVNAAGQDVDETADGLTRVRHSLGQHGGLRT